MSEEKGMSWLGCALAGCGGLVVIAILWVVLTAMGLLHFGAKRAVVVAQRELDPVVLQQKYEWFKDAAAACDQKRASIKVMQGRIDRLQADYKDVKRREWARDDREQQSVWESEVSGLKASYNDLASQYNAQMAKWNWRFCERGQLPQGATEPLPRKFKPYVVE